MNWKSTKRHGKEDSVTVDVVDQSLTLMKRNQEPDRPPCACTAATPTHPCEPRRGAKLMTRDYRLGHCQHSAQGFAALSACRNSIIR